MGILDGIVDAMTGGLGGKIVDAVTKYFPPDMTPEQKANIELAAKNIELQQTAEANRAREAAEVSINERIAMYEGTAKDLLAIPILGSLMLFLRGSQRIVWGLGTIYLDYMVFSGTWDLTKDAILANAFWVVNFLVLGFLFGERAVVNIMPFITEMMKAKKGVA